MRHEELTIGRAVVNELVSPAGSNLLTNNALAENKMFVGNAGGQAAAKTAAEVLSLLLAGAGYYPVYAGVSDAENDADASVVITKTGVAATDVAFAVMVAGTTAQAVKKVVCTQNTVTVTLAGNGGAGTQVFYLVFRAIT
jgi:hypothetical protein